VFELFYFSDYLLPHRLAAWRLFSERLDDLASFAARLAEDPEVPAEIATVRDNVVRIVGELAEHIEDRNAEGPPPGRTV
jgi:hypothetical protein